MFCLLENNSSKICHWQADRRSPVGQHWFRLLFLDWLIPCPEGVIRRQVRKGPAMPVAPVWHKWPIIWCDNNDMWRWRQWWQAASSRSCHHHHHHHCTWDDYGNNGQLNSPCCYHKWAFIFRATAYFLQINNLKITTRLFSVFHLKMIFKSLLIVAWLDFLTLWCVCEFSLCGIIKFQWGLKAWQIVFDPQPTAADCAEHN